MARLAFDLRWKVALTLGLDFDPPHSSSLSVFRSRLLEHSQERYAFDRLLAIGRAAGFLPEKATVLIDTTPQLGAGAVQDTYTLIRNGIRRVLKAAGYQAAGKRRGLASNLGAYLESDHKAETLAPDASAGVDWNDATARAGPTESPGGRCPRRLGDRSGGQRRGRSAGGRLVADQNPGR